MTISEMSRQAQRRGIHLLATGDWTHPVWSQQLQSDLTEWSPGIFASKANPEGAKFLLSTEISCIYSQASKLRRIHLLVMVPSFTAVAKITQALLKRGANLHADGRPIIGLSCIALSELVFEAEPQALIIPAHAWTPWFGILGSNGGFDSLAEAFGQFADKIYAVETGLSSDPLMNWRIPELDSRAIVSFGDAHSPPKMGREATVFEFKNPKAEKYTYEDIYQAIAERSLAKNKGNLKLDYTIEFYPEEGKYHWDGHRACQVVHPPSQTRKVGDICPVCGKKLTIGVENRVETLAEPQRLGELSVKKSLASEVVISSSSLDPTRPPFVNLVPLQEIIADVLGKGFDTKGVTEKYNELLEKVGDEFSILLKIPEVEIQSVAGVAIAQGVMQMRRGALEIDPGFDGVYGKVHLKKESTDQEEQPGLF